MRDEGPFLLEWIAHHRALGVTDFLVYTNECQDGSDWLLDRLADAGVLHHVPQQVKPGKSVQWQALKDAWTQDVVQGADWILPLDCDEFVNLRPPMTGLADMIAAAEEADAILLPWRFFGHNGQAFFATDPVTERFTRAIPTDATFPVIAASFKTLFRRAGPFAKLGVHRPKMREGATARFLDGSGAPMGAAFARADGRIVLPGRAVASDWVQLNHYTVRSAEDFMVKRRRGLPNRGAIKPVDAAYWAERNFNLETDRSIAIWRDGTAREEAALRALPGVTEARANCIEQYRAGIADILSDPDEAKLFGRLLLMQTSVPPAPELAAEILRRYQAAVKNG